MEPQWNHHIQAPANSSMYGAAPQMMNSTLTTNDLTGSTNQMATGVQIQPGPFMLPRDQALNALRNQHYQTYLRQVVENQALSLKKDLRTMQRASNNLSERIDGLEREISILRLDLSKSQRLNTVYVEDNDRLKTERRELIWKNFDLELENDILKHTVEMYRSTESKKPKKRCKSANRWRY